MTVTEAIKDYINKNGNYPKFITIKTETMIELLKDKDHTYYTIIPYYIDNRIKEDFLLNDRGF